MGLGKSTIKASAWRQPLMEPLRLVGSYVELSHLKYPNRFIRLRCNFSPISRQAPSCSGRSKTDPGAHTRIPCSELCKAGDRCVHWLLLVQHCGNLRPAQQSTRTDFFPSSAHSSYIFIHKDTILHTL